MIRKQTILLVVTIVAALIVMGAAATPVVVPQQGTDWTVSVLIHELHDTTDNDAYEGYDFYHEIRLYLMGTEQDVLCRNLEQRSEDDYHLYLDPPWGCAMDVSDADAYIRALIRIYDHDSPSEDDKLDIHPDSDFDEVWVQFWPASHRMNIEGINDDPGEDDDVDEEGEFQCARGEISLQGEQGVDRAGIVFSVTGAAAGARDGDSDGDGLTDAAEACGVDSDGDGGIDVDLPAMGADPFRRDLFVEIDWMVESDGGADHSHEPWLPALINAWHELDQAPISGPIPPDGIARPGGIALHVDVGSLYANYALDFDGDHVNELSVDASGNVDVDPDGPAGPLLPDGIVDIGNLGVLGTPGGGTPGGGNRICADLTTQPPCPANLLGEDNRLSMADASTTRSNYFVANRGEVFFYVIFGDQLNTGTAGGWTPWGDADFVVTLGSGGNLEGGLRGPSGLPAFGSIDEHTGTFLHELGHALGLRHGGDDDINYKPNYISIMNYTYSRGKGVAYDLNGDGIFGDPLIGYDLNHDGEPDDERHTYSRDLPFSNFPGNPAPGGLAPLAEADLNELDGIGDGLALVYYGPASIDQDGDTNCDVYCTVPPLNVRVAPGNTPIDWSRGDNDVDGTVDNDLGVNALTTQAGIPTDINAMAPGQVIIFPEVLTGFNDYNFLQNQKLKPATEEEEAEGQAHPDVTLEDDKAFMRSVLRVRELTDAEAIAACETQSTVYAKFEEVPPGQAVTDQYATEGIYFLADAIRRPTIAGPGQRFDKPTTSPPNSLLNAPIAPADSGGVPLVISFDPPARIVSFYFGRVKAGNPAKDMAMLTAFDTDGVAMGSIQRTIPDFNQGISAQMVLGAVLPDQLIARIELNYLLNPVSNPLEPEHIDDLMVCRQLVARQPQFPDAPGFGERTVNVTISAMVLSATPSAVEPGRQDWEAEALTGISVAWARPDVQQNGMDETGFALTLSEGEDLNLTAPAQAFHQTLGPLTFLYWQQDGSLSFSLGEVAMNSRLLHNTSFTALYQAGQYGTNTVQLPLLSK